MQNTDTSLDIVAGAKAIGQIIGETPRRTFTLMQRQAIPCWKRGGRYVASRAALEEYKAGGFQQHPVAAPLDMSREAMRADILEEIIRTIRAEQAASRAERAARGGGSDDYKRMESADYLPPVTPLAIDVARLLADESFPRELWERHHRADAPAIKAELPLHE